MKEISDEIYAALAVVAAMQHPSAAQLLRKYRYNYEADRVEELTKAFDKFEKETGKTTGS